MFNNDWMKDFQTKIPDLLANGTRVLIYAGDVDFICNWIVSCLTCRSSVVLRGVSMLPCFSLSTPIC